MAPLERFTDFDSDIATAQVLLYGIPFEGSVNLRKGAAEGPAAIRRHSHLIETYSPHLDRDLEDLELFDGGDFRVDGPTVHAVLESVAAQVAERVPAGRRAFFLGGDHTITYATLKAFSARHDGLSVLQLDAHPDRQDLFPDEPYNYASVIARALEFIPPTRVYQVGMRTGARAEYANRFGTHFFPVSRLPFLESVAWCARELAGKPTYVTIDVDVLDPSAAPGTGSLEPAGVSVPELLEAIGILGTLDVVAGDLVEIAPPLDDASGRTSLLGACLVRDCILHWWA